MIKTAAIKDDGDLFLIESLLKTMSMTEIAEKWEVTKNDIGWFMVANALYSVEIKFNHRSEHIINNSGRSNFDLSLDLECSESTIRNVKKKMAKKGICYA